MNFISKGRTLKTLKVKNAIIPKLYIFTVARYKRNRNIVLKDIKNYFNSHIAIRSSGLMEDTTTSSKAGKFKSILNIDSQNILSVDRAINQVISSYKNYENPNNEILIQTMVENVIFSGVAFSCDKDTAAPYFTINYTRTKNTFDITSGKVNAETFVMFKDSPVKPKSKFILKIINLIIELLKITKYDRLDIEFAIDKSKKIYLLQVRPLVINKSTKKVLNIEPYLRNINKKIKKLQKPHPDLFGKKSYFGVMPDWNPAEIIGLRPNPLAISLYQELITDHVWSLHRKDYGFRDLSSNHLMTSFFGMPYIDVRVDFNSWIPSNLNDNLSKKLVEYYLLRFQKSPELHDKTEFEILFTCLTPSTNKKISKLKKFGFKRNEINEIKKSLKTINENAFNQYVKNIHDIEKLKIKQNQILKSNMYSIDKIYWLIEDCKKFGTYPFAGLARCGFIAIDILNSFVEEKILSIEDKDIFLQNIDTIASKIQIDSYKLNKQQFLKKHGHIRPNTYEITSKNYKDGYNEYFGQKKNTNINKNKLKKFKLNKIQINKISHFLKTNKLNINYKDLIIFIKNSISNREYSKYVFTKSIDGIFEILKEIGKRHSIEVKDLSYVKIQTILDLYYNLTTKNIKDLLIKEINMNKKEFNKSISFKLPEIIYSFKDIYNFLENEKKVNFIGNSVSLAKAFFMKNNNNKKFDLKNKIICIKSADPGYDFIFSQKIAGLITEFGGVNSHMAIRCAELSIPAAIGVGQNKFKNIINSKVIRLDCETSKVDLIK